MKRDVFIKKNCFNSIEVYDFSISRLYVLKTEIKIFNFILRKGGILHKFHNEYVNLNDNTDIVLKDKKVYTKPRCIISMPNRKFHTLYFDTYSDALDFAKMNCNNKYISNIK